MCSSSTAPCGRRSGGSTPTRGAGTSTTRQSPMPISGHSRTAPISCSNQRSSESGSRCCARTLTRRAPNRPVRLTGTTSSSLAAVENPALPVSDHCIGVRIASRSGKRQVLAHADLLAVPQHRGAGHGELQRVRQLDVPPVAVQHRRQPTPDAPAVEPHVRPRARRPGTRPRVARRSAGSGPVRRGCAGTSPTAPCGQPRQVGQRLRSAAPRPRRARASQSRAFSRKENIMWARSLGPSDAVAGVLGRRRSAATFASHSSTASPVRHCRSWRQSSRMREVLRCRVDTGRHLLQHERRGVHPEAGRAELQPEPHDLADLVADRGVGPVQVGLEVVEPVEVPGLGRLVVGPGLGLLTGKDDALPPVRRVPCSLQTYQSRYGDSGSRPARTGTRDAGRRCG